MSVQEPTVLTDGDGEVVIAAIRTYGDTIHSLVERRNYRGLFLPGFQPVTPRYQPAPVGLRTWITASATCELGKMNEWVGFYEKVMGFKNLVSFDDKDISTEYSALMSKVMANGNERIKFPINEPASGKKKSQIEEYLDFYRGPGRAAHRHARPTTSSPRWRALPRAGRGVPHGARQLLRRAARRGSARSTRTWRRCRELGILVDRDDEGYLLQIFTKPVQDRPTLFYEIIQRKGARSFGKGNFKALFESIEREQAARGNL